MSDTKNLYMFMNAYTQGRSGGDIFCIELCKRLSGFQKYIITSQAGKMLYKNMKHKVSFFITDFITEKEKKPYHYIFSYVKRTLKAFSLKSILQKRSVFFASSDFFPDVFPAFFLKKKHIKWIQAIYHIYPYALKRKGNIFINISGFYLQRLSFFLIKKRADLILTINPLVKQELVRLGFDRKKIKVIGNGIDIDSIQTVKKSAISTDGIFVGRLHQTKGVFDLIEIWKYVVRQVPHAKLALIGKGTHGITQQIEKRIMKNNLQENIILFGDVENTMMYSLIKATQVFVFPSHEEGFGRAVAEAMACGTPVVAWNLSTYKAMFDTHYQAVEYGNIKRFATSIIEILRHKKLKTDKTEGAKKFILKYSWKNVLPQYIKIFTI